MSINRHRGNIDGDRLPEGFAGISRSPAISPPWGYNLEPFLPRGAALGYCISLLWSSLFATHS